MAVATGVLKNQSALSGLRSWVKTHPLLFKTATGTVTAGAANYIAQVQESPAAYWDITSLDARKFFIFTTFGAVWTGPINHVLFRFLDRAFKAVTPKLLFQGLALNPILYVPSFIVATHLIQSKSKTSLAEGFKEMYANLLVSCNVFWLPVSAVCFRFVPELYQSVTFALVGFAWNLYLSRQSKKKKIE